MVRANLIQSNAGSDKVQTGKIRTKSSRDMVCANLARPVSGDLQPAPTWRGPFLAVHKSRQPGGDLVLPKNDPRQLGAT